MQVNDATYEIRVEIQSIVFCMISRHATVHQDFLLERLFTLILTAREENNYLIYRLASGAGCTRNITKIDQ